MLEARAILGNPSLVQCGFHRLGKQVRGDLQTELRKEHSQDG